MQNSHKRSIHVGILNAYGFQSNFKKYDKFNHKIRSNFYTECPRTNLPDFGRMFLMLKYTDITQNTYIQS
jgi:NADPH-dependent 7-cyano-7-deazaguanine reductase QueF